MFGTKTFLSGFNMQSNLLIGTPKGQAECYAGVHVT